MPRCILLHPCRCGKQRSFPSLSEVFAPRNLSPGHWPLMSAMQWAFYSASDECWRRSLAAATHTHACHVSSHDDCSGTTVLHQEVYRQQEEEVEDRDVDVVANWLVTGAGGQVGSHILWAAATAPWHAGGGAAPPVGCESHCLSLDGVSVPATSHDTSDGGTADGDGGVPNRLLRLAGGAARKKGVQRSRVIGVCSPTGAAPIAGFYVRCDLLDDVALRSLLIFLRPEVVIHCGGCTQVNAALSDPALAERLNVGVVARLRAFLAQISPGRAASNDDAAPSGSERAAPPAARSSLLMYMSTDMVFNGAPDRTTGSFDEATPTSPVSCYGRSKRRGELAALGMLENEGTLSCSSCRDVAQPNSPRVVVVRLPLMIGTALTTLRLDGRELPNSFLAQLLPRVQRWAAASRRGRGGTTHPDAGEGQPDGSPPTPPPMRLFTDEFRSALTMARVARALLRLGSVWSEIDDESLSPVVHLTSGAASALSRYDIGVKCITAIDTLLNAREGGDQQEGVREQVDRTPKGSFSSLVPYVIAPSLLQDVVSPEPRPANLSLSNTLAVSWLNRNLTEEEEQQEDHVRRGQRGALPSVPAQDFLTLSDSALQEAVELHLLAERVRGGRAGE